jgi:glycosyltransferase involved in cell wall biosynthesis
VQRQRSDVTFLAVGDGPTLAHYQNIYDRYPGIVFTGRRNDAKNLVQLFFVGVLCSYIEGFPNAVIEYMALGKPVVVTDGGGIRELVLDGQTGYVVPASTPQSCEEKILILLDNPEMAQDMGMSGLLRIGEKVSIRTAIENL